VRIDVREINRRPDVGVLKYVPRVVPQGRKLDQRAAVAFEVSVVDRVEPVQGGE
jgi:hypothetical protein